MAQKIVIHNLQWFYTYNAVLLGSTKLLGSNKKAYKIYIA
jgi:hypothetical protein